METTHRYASVMKRFAAIIFVVFVVAGCGEGARDSVAAYRSQILEWQEKRQTGLKKEDSWLSLVGLFWLNSGENRVGSDPTANTIVLPASTPRTVGTLVLRDGKVTLHPVAPMTIGGKPVTGPVELLDDAAENGPTIVQIGTVRFNIIKRGDRHGVRVRDSEAKTRTEFAGLEYYPVDPKWRVEARLEPHAEPKVVPIADVTGMTTEYTSPGTLVFTVDGREHRLDTIPEEGGDRLFIIFKDETSRDTTYPAGRYLYAERPGPDGKVIVDFNRAYNPPCAFTDFATCPLPPPQNRLRVAVEAGEKKYAKGHA